MVTANSAQEIFYRVSRGQGFQPACRQAGIQDDLLIIFHFPFLTVHFSFFLLLPSVIMVNDI
jgi:hypothetical protein